MNNRGKIIPEGFLEDYKLALIGAEKDIRSIIEMIEKKYPMGRIWCANIDGVRSKAKTPLNGFNDKEIMDANLLLEAIKNYRVLKGGNLTEKEVNSFFSKTQYIDGIEVMEDGRLAWAGRPSHEGDFSQEERAVLERMSQDIQKLYKPKNGSKSFLAEGLKYNMEEALIDAENNTSFIDCFTSYCSMLGIDLQEGFRKYCVKLNTPQETRKNDKRIKESKTEELQH